MMRIEYKMMPGLWMTVEENIPEDHHAAIWANWCWKTSAPIRLIDCNSGLITREFHPARRK